MRVLCVSSYYKPAYVYGGPTRCISALCEGIAQQGARVTVYTTNANGKNLLDIPTNQAILLNGVQVHYYPISYILPRRYFYSKMLGDACRANIDSFDVIHVIGNWVFPVVAAAYPSIRQKVPFIISPHGSFMEWSFRQKEFKKRLYLEIVERHLINRAAAIHCTSQMEADQTIKFGFRSSISVIPNVISPFNQNYNLTRGTVRKRLGIPQDDPVTIYVGRFHKMKRVDRVIEIFSHVQQEIPNAHLLLAGEDEDGTGIQAQQMVHDFNLESQVHFTGLLQDDDLAHAYMDSDLLVLFSHRENFGMVVTEALSMGVPVLLSKYVGIAREVADGEAGLIVDVDSEDAAKKWEWLLKTPEKRKEMAQAGINLTKTLYSPENVSKEMIKLFERVIADN